MEEDEGDFGSVDCWGTSHSGLSLEVSQPSGAPLFMGCSHCGVTRDEEGWVVTICVTCCLRHRGSSEVDRSKEFLCEEGRRAGEESPRGEEEIGGNCTFVCSCMSTIAVSDVCRFRLRYIWGLLLQLLTSAPVRSSCRCGLTPRRLCPEETGLENKESEAWKSLRSMVVL